MIDLYALCERNETIRILVETEAYIYELIPLHRDGNSVVMHVNSGHPLFRGKAGDFSKCAGCIHMAPEGAKDYVGQLVKDAQMLFLTKGSTVVQTAPIVSACVSGWEWSYEAIS